MVLGLSLCSDNAVVFVHEKTIASLRFLHMDWSAFYTTAQADVHFATIARSQSYTLPQSFVQFVCCAIVLLCGTLVLIANMAAVWQLLERVRLLHGGCPIFLESIHQLLSPLYIGSHYGEYNYSSLTSC